jgi:alkylation response protein AidB-like acyl-CoA dehydrogenase
MDFNLPEQTRQIEQNVREWALSHTKWPRDNHAFSRGRWRELLDLGVVDVEAHGGTILDTVAAFMAIGRAGMPGPLLEAHLAAAAGYARDGDEIVTSTFLRSPTRTQRGFLVGWGSVADVTVDASSGTVLRRGPLPAVSLTYPFPHGWLDSTEADVPSNCMLARAWVVGAALIAGLADAAVTQSVAHTQARRQFGRALGSFQAVQTRLVDSLLAMRTLRSAVLDAASRTADGRPGAEVAAAISWLAAGRASRVVERNSHQVHGAAGFALETGLVGFTWPMWWIRESIGRGGAMSFLRQGLRRDEQRPTLIRELFAR